MVERGEGGRLASLLRELARHRRERAQCVGGNGGPTSGGGLRVGVMVRMVPCELGVRVVVMMVVAQVVVVVVGGLTVVVEMVALVWLLLLVLL